jgi:MFS family permease
VVAAAVPIGICSGVFLGVDWALMTDIIPKAESGRYMGISNIAVAGAGPIGAAVGGLITFIVALLIADRTMAADIGYRTLFVVMAIELALGALALRRVREPVRAGDRHGTDEPQPAVA